jgi:hypothetical protein
MEYQLIRPMPLSSGPAGKDVLVTACMYEGPPDRMEYPAGFVL